MITVLGASGFIGSNLVRWLESQSVPFQAPGRDEDLRSRSLDHVIYCIGLTADFRERPFDTVRAHVCHLLSILEGADFESLLYLSTTRLYGKAGTSAEDAELRVNPLDPSDLYNISKIMGESLGLNSRRGRVRVARLSNVYGGDFSSNNFLSSVIRDAVENGEVSLRTALDSEKDYVSVEDVIALLPRIALGGRHLVYNIASGVNTSNGVLMEAIKRATPCTFRIEAKAETIIFPPIEIGRVREEFDFSPSSILNEIDDLARKYERQIRQR